MAANLIAGGRLSARQLMHNFRCISTQSGFLRSLNVEQRNDHTKLRCDSLHLKLHTQQNARSFHTTVGRYADTTVNCPPFADSITEGDIRWEKAVGDYVEVDETIGEVETDKTSLAVKSTVSGTISSFLVEDGTTITPGTAIATITPGEGSASAAAPPPPASEDKPAPPPPAATQTQESAPIPTSKPPTPPLPSGPMTSTPTSQIKPVVIDSPSILSAPVSRSEERVKMNRMRLRIAERLKEAQNTCAMLTTFNEVDMSNVMDLRNVYKDAFLKKHGVKLGFMSAFVKASAFALQDQPIVNAVIDGNEMVYRDYVDISVAVSTPKGLVVPVLRNVETMNYAEVEKGIQELGVKATEGRLAVEDMDGGTFTISNGGVFGSMFGTPIINPPQSAILGMHAIFNRPMAINGQVEIRPMMYIALTYDHRLIDGREAVTFLKKIKSAVEDPRVLLVDL